MPDKLEVCPRCGRRHREPGQPVCFTCAFIVTNEHITVAGEAWKTDPSYLQFPHDADGREV